MVFLYGRQWRQEELLRQVGAMEQLAGIKPWEAIDGVERGTRISRFGRGAVSRSTFWRIERWILPPVATRGSR